MIPSSKQELLELLELPDEEYAREILPQTRELLRTRKNNTITANALLGYDNICRNQCLYCGMRAGNPLPPRYRMEPEQILALAKTAREAGLEGIFYISGEDPSYGFDNLLRIVEETKALGFKRISMAVGEFSKDQFRALRDAGVDTYAMKFEMSQKEIFERLNPSASFLHRMECIQWLRELGVRLGTGSIVDYPGQTLEQLAEDLLLTAELKADWAPIIPYMPAKGTPMAEEGKRGSVSLTLRAISILRMMLPEMDITAQQPGADLRKGLADPDANRDAIRAGANLLFVDLLPAAQAKNFSVIDNRTLSGMDHVRHMGELMEMKIQL